MTEKRVAPLNNPSSEKSQLASYLHCPYCEFITKFTDSLQRHKSRFHESELASEGVESLREGGDKYKRYEKYLLAHGYVKCPWWTVPCPTKINPLMARVCKHLNDCPVRREYETTQSKTR